MAGSNFGLFDTSSDSDSEDSDPPTYVSEPPIKKRPTSVREVQENNVAQMRHKQKIQSNYVADRPPAESNQEKEDRKGKKKLERGRKKKENRKSKSEKKRIQLAGGKTTTAATGELEITSHSRAKRVTNIDHHSAGEMKASISAPTNTAKQDTSVSEFTVTQDDENEKLYQHPHDEEDEEEVLVAEDQEEESDEDEESADNDDSIVVSLEPINHFIWIGDKKCDVEGRKTFSIDGQKFKVLRDKRGNATGFASRTSKKTLGTVTLVCGVFTQRRSSPMYLCSGCFRFETKAGL